MSTETTTTQDTPAEMLIKLWPWLERNWKKIAGVAVVILVVIGIYNFRESQRQANERAAGAALTQLMMTPPAGVNPAEALSKLAVTYAGTMAAQRAQLQAAATDFGTAKFAEAQAIFEKFVAENAGSPLVGTAQLGIGASLEAQGKLEPAAAAYQKVSSTYAATPNALPALCGLGRIAEAQGKLKEALDHYETAARAAAAGGTLAQEAAMRAAELRPKVAALAPKAASPATLPGAASSTVTVPAAK